MKTKNLIFSLALIFSLVLALNLVSANVAVTYNANYAVIEDDGSITVTSTPVTDFDSVGYVCTSANCATVSSHVAGLGVSTATDTITLSYPTLLVNSNGYGVYFYKPGYIGWEMNPNWAGDGTVAQNYDIYLLRKASGFANIMNLNVINEVHPNLPIEVNFAVGIDAQTSSAIDNAGPLQYQPSETSAINVVETQVTLEIRDSSNVVVYTDSQTVNVPFSGTSPVSFTYAGFSQTGDYTVEVHTDISDAKILAPESRSASSNIRVIPQNQVNYAYTLINNLHATPSNPDAGDNVEFSFNYLSNYVDADGNILPRNTDLEVRIYKDGDLISTKTYDLTPAQTEFSFSKIISSGSYQVIVEGSPDTTNINPASIVPITQQITFGVDHIDHDGNEEDKKNTDSDNEDKVDSDKPLMAGTINLSTSDTDTPMSLAKKIIYSLTIGILILLIAILIIAAIKYGWFK